MKQTQKLTITNDDRAIGRKRLTHILDNLDEGDWEVTVKEWKDKRSLRQNNLYWQWVTICAEERGYSKDGMHEAFLMAFAPKKTVEKLDGSKEEKPVRTSEMNTKQMSDYMRLVDREAAENGTVLPRPKEDDLI